MHFVKQEAEKACHLSITQIEPYYNSIAMTNCSLLQIFKVAKYNAQEVDND